jgi:hypothetical protein
MPQGLDEGKSFYQGRSPRPRVGFGEKSAEAIVVVSNEPMSEAEDSQDNEGLNVGLSRIRYGGSNFEFASLILNKDRGVFGVKSDSTDT